MSHAEQIDALKGLLERVKAAEGANYAIECAVGRALEGLNPYHRTPPNYTASVDAALSLVHRLIPGTMWATGNMEEGPFCRLVYPLRQSGRWGLAETTGQSGGPANEALAILACLLSAKLALLTQEESNA